MCWHKYKWSEVKTEDLKEKLTSTNWGKMQGESIDVTYWYQDAYCQKCNKYFYRRIEK